MQKSSNAPLWSPVKLHSRPIQYNSAIIFDVTCKTHPNKYLPFSVLDDILINHTKTERYGVQNKWIKKLKTIYCIRVCAWRVALPTNS